MNFIQMKTSLLSLMFIAVMNAPLFSQNEDDVNPEPSESPESEKAKTDLPDQPGLPRFWEAKLGSGEFVIALDRITSVSRHKYVLDGALIVDEVTIDTTGQSLARFYYITPITSAAPGAAASQVAESATGLLDSATRASGSDLQNMVVKKYPLTTHAKSIEYRLLSESQLNVLFESAKTAWQTGEGRVFTGR